MSYRTTVTLHDAQIEALFSGPIRRAVERVVNEGHRLSRAAIPRDTGQLARTLQKGVERRGAPDGDLFGWWGSAEKYALWVHNGTGIFGPTGTPIRPKRAKFLVFVPSGKNVGARQLGDPRRRAKSRRTGAVFARSVVGQPRTPFLVEPFRIVMTGVPIRIHGGALSSLPF